MFLQFVLRHRLGNDEKEPAPFRFVDVATRTLTSGICDHHLQRSRVRRKASAVHRLHGQCRFGRLGELDVGDATLFEHPHFFDGAKHLERFLELFFRDVLPADDEESRVRRIVRFGSGPFSVLRPRRFFVKVLASFVN